MNYYSPEVIKGSMYGYMPLMAPNAVGLALTGILFLFQTILGLYYRQWWFFVTWEIGVGFLVAGYALRIRAHFDLLCDECYKAQFCFFILAPAFIMAGVYYQMSKLATIYGLKFIKLKPMAYTGLFIACDVISIIIQAVGGGMSAGTNDDNTSEAGRWIVVAGIAFQCFSMGLFIVLFTWFLYDVYRAPASEYEPTHQKVRDRPLFKFLVPAVYICMAFVYTRSIYRLIELAQGWHGHLYLQEGYFLVLEGLMMILAISTMTIVYPGVVYGRESLPVVGLHSKKHFQDTEDQESSLAKPELHQDF